MAEDLLDVDLVPERRRGKLDDQERSPWPSASATATSCPRASKPPFTIMGSLWGVEAGLRQMRRTRPLETCEVPVGDDAAVVAPTAPEALRIKAFLVVQRNVVRDYLDVAALAEHLRLGTAVGWPTSGRASGAGRPRENHR
ncbi:MAG: hypothetical protein AB1Z67_03985 [Candidatus Limnocylindrales bacterium]